MQYPRRPIASSIMGIRRRGGTIFWAASPSVRRRVQADKRTHLIHRPARDIIPPLGGALFPPIAFDPAQLSSHCDFPRPPELGPVNPHAVHDDVVLTVSREKDGKLRLGYAGWDDTKVV